MNSNNLRMTVLNKVAVSNTLSVKLDEFVALTEDLSKMKGDLSESYMLQRRKYFLENIVCIKSIRKACKDDNYAVIGQDCEDLGISTIKVYEDDKDLGISTIKVCKDDKDLFIRKYDIRYGQRILDALKIAKLPKNIISMNLNIYNAQKLLSSSKKTVEKKTYVLSSDVIKEGNRKLGMSIELFIKVNVLLEQVSVPAKEAETFIYIISIMPNIHPKRHCRDYHYYAFLSFTDNLFEDIPQKFVNNKLQIFCRKIEKLLKYSDDQEYKECLLEVRKEYMQYYNMILYNCAISNNNDRFYKVFRVNPSNSRELQVKSGRCLKNVYQNITIHDIRESQFVIGYSFLYVKGQEFPHNVYAKYGNIILHNFANAVINGLQNEQSIEKILAESGNKFSSIPRKLLRIYTTFSIITYIDNSTEERLCRPYCNLISLSMMSSEERKLYLDHAVNEPRAFFESYFKNLAVNDQSIMMNHFENLINNIMQLLSEKSDVEVCKVDETIPVFDARQLVDKKDFGFYYNFIHKFVVSVFIERSIMQSYSSEEVKVFLSHTLYGVQVESVLKNVGDCIIDISYDTGISTDIRACSTMNVLIGNREKLNDDVLGL